MGKRPEYITSRQNALLVLTEKLTDRKHRWREGLFRFDGRKLFEEALTARLPLSAVLLRESNAQELLALTENAPLPDNCRTVILPDALFDRISEEKAPEGVICVAKHLDKLHKIATINKGNDAAKVLLPGRTLILESVRDPGNLGTIIRSARAFGVANLLLSSDCADIYHPRTIRAAMGTLFSQHILIVEDLTEAVRALGEERRVFAAALDVRAAKLGSVSFSDDDIAVVGNEGHGISAALLDACTHSIYIPMNEGVESLNAGIAASVLLWEMYRGNTCSMN